MTGIALLVVILLCLLFGGTWYLARLRRQRLEQAGKHRDAFFRAAGKLVENPHTPESVGDLLLLLGAGMTRAVVLKRLAWHLVIGIKEPSDRSKEEVARSFRDLELLPEGLKLQFSECMQHLVLAVLYQFTMVGPVLRLRLRRDQDHGRGANLLARDLAGLQARCA